MFHRSRVDPVAAGLDLLRADLRDEALVPLGEQCRIPAVALRQATPQHPQRADERDAVRVDSLSPRGRDA